MSMIVTQDEWSPTFKKLADLSKKLPQIEREMNARLALRFPSQRKGLKRGFTAGPDHREIFRAIIQRERLKGELAAELQARINSELTR
jgi:hypothetical protein